VDDDGILCAGGRLEFSTVIPFESKCPMILPSHGEAIESLVRREHELQLHAGVNHTLASLRKKFFILGCDLWGKGHDQTLGPFVYLYGL
jgi:hypothetical protein